MMSDAVKAALVTSVITLLGVGLKGCSDNKICPFGPCWTQSSEPRPTPAPVPTQNVKPSVVPTMAADAPSPPAQPKIISAPAVPPPASTDSTRLDMQSENAKVTAEAIRGAEEDAGMPADEPRYIRVHNPCDTDIKTYVFFLNQDLGAGTESVFMNNWSWPSNSVNHVGIGNRAGAITRHQFILIYAEDARGRAVAGGAHHVYIDKTLVGAELYKMGIDKSSGDFTIELGCGG